MVKRHTRPRGTRRHRRNSQERTCIETSPAQLISCCLTRRTSLRSHTAKMSTHSSPVRNCNRLDQLCTRMHRRTHHPRMSNRSSMGMMRIHRDRCRKCHQPIHWRMYTTIALHKQHPCTYRQRMSTRSYTVTKHIQQCSCISCHHQMSHTLCCRRTRACLSRHAHIRIASYHSRSRLHCMHPPPHCRTDRPILTHTCRCTCLPSLYRYRRSGMAMTRNRRY